ncbi:aldehyde dehydrogenase family protein [Natronosporangium hydrolyticum]|uniref:aldehyde dehydrogenase (NAD(+)) n=1 Tax=Natronosporangium hydrolyticum TaxID=2811111 RepID=A0A895YN14_9ACTN|nr:aldehyde dehydrogenase family protein [Natronosporangium hydrolyticum]QSB17352.1 aldehyde dehydrogenase family protein [Natronosporangium hydrolyticum]
MTHDTLYIGGSWASPSSDERRPVTNPATGAVIGTVPDAGPADLARALSAARAAFPVWAATSLPERVAVLRAIRDGLAARHDELADLITAEMGAPRRVSRSLQVGLPLQVLDGYLSLLAEPAAEPELIGHSRVYRQPVGVVAAITPWNYPIHQAIAKIAPALAAGCPVVLKPSELTPLSTYLLTEIIDAAGLPPGGFNLICGPGAAIGAELVADPTVDLVSFTGSTRAGRQVAAAAAGQLTRVALELGGKSANILLPDADHRVAVKVGVANCFLNTGQTCTALSRMLVHTSAYEEAVERAGEYAAGFTVGDPTDPGTRLGPLVSAAQRDRVQSLVQQGIAAGARLVTGGPAATGLPETGHYVAPTVLADVPPGSELAQEEVFGPVLSILPYRDVDEAVRIANHSRYGLTGGVWSADPERAVAVARRLRTGQVDINGAAFNPVAPFGGYGDSGLGREHGRYGLAEYQELTSVQLPEPRS